MSEPKHRVLVPGEAARIIYHTENPSPEQIDKVRYKLARGLLKSSSQGRWTTTPEAVAEYLSHRTSHQAAKRRQESGHKPLFALYRELLQDYCLAVLARRSTTRRSGIFETLVIMGQLGCLVMIIGAVLAGHRYGFPDAVPEQAAVEHWLSDHADDFQIIEWYPVQGRGTEETCRLRVKYKYMTAKRKSVLTDRIFIIRNRQVVEVSQTE